MTAVSYGNPENAETFRIAGLTDENYYTGPLSGYHLTVIVSERALKAFAEEFFVSKVGIRYEQEYDSRTEERLISLIDESPYAADFSLESKIGEMKSVEEAQGGMMETGIGIAVLLALIGILNYINTVIGSLTERQRELAVLESIGMTGGQMKRMLITEGISIAAGALILTATAGTAVTYWLYQAMNYRGIPFSIPVLPAAVAAGIVLLICILIPPAVGRRTRKRTGTDGTHTESGMRPQSMKRKNPPGVCRGIFSGRRKASGKRLRKKDDEKRNRAGQIRQDRFRRNIPPLPLLFLCRA